MLYGDKTRGVAVYSRIQALRRFVDLFMTLQVGKGIIPIAHAVV